MRDNLEVSEVSVAERRLLSLQEGLNESSGPSQMSSMGGVLLKIWFRFQYPGMLGVFTQGEI